MRHPVSQVYTEQERAPPPKSQPHLLGVHGHQLRRRREHLGVPRGEPLDCDDELGLLPVRAPGVGGRRPQAVDQGLQAAHQKSGVAWGQVA